jgi:hypothetical protein
MDQHATREGCCGDSACGCHRGEFSRVRYFFGQRLGVVDFNDHLAWQVGKQRFANSRLHGAGVLCGLRAERFVFPQGADPKTTPTTLLRVTRGAALDGCGREILVPVDQCIDVDAWLAVHRERPEIQDWFNKSSPSTPVVWIGLRYRECPSGPAPAPRDPCGCDAGGCEYSRTLEGYELALLTQGDVDGLNADKPREPGDLLSAVALPAELPAGMSTVAAVRRHLATQMAADCAVECGGDWLLLAKVELKVDANLPQRVRDIEAVDFGIPQRHSLMPTAMIQSLVEALVAREINAGGLMNGPSLSGVIRFTKPTNGSGTLSVEVRLMKEGTPTIPVPLENNSFKSEFIQVMKLDNSGWTNVGATAVLKAEEIEITLPVNSSAGDYRLTIAAPPETPIVDTNLRSLQPERFVKSFRLKDENGTLQLAPMLVN